jgi:8-hydroxy-5-deazaflavin:NADPH oxidoreductase
MKIGIIGAGMIGGTLARRLVALGHEVALANSRGLDTLRGFAAKIGAKAVTVTEAATSGEIVIIAIPQRAVMDLPKDLFAGVSNDVIVVDTCNYYPVRDDRIAAIEEGQVESEWVSEQLGRPVVKVFNNIIFSSLLENGQPAGATGRIALPVAGDPPAGRANVMGLVEDLGFDAVDAGSLAESWRQQPGTPAYVHDFDVPRLRAALAAAERSRIPEYRSAANEAARAYFQQPR